MATTIQVRRGTAAEWTAANPTLNDGEIGFERDTNQMKVGNGSTAWNALTYLIADSSGISSVTLADLPPGSLVVVDKAKAVYGPAGSWPSTRPTSRTDLVVLWLGDTDPGGIAISGDIIDLLG